MRIWRSRFGLACGLAFLEAMAAGCSRPSVEEYEQDRNRYLLDEMVFREESEEADSIARQIDRLKQRGEMDSIPLLEKRLESESGEARRAEQRMLESRKKLEEYPDYN